ncbi:MAG: hypothetical protein HY040_21675 [Planctomycetes bacterium]|nr:hypothetical protein [Planctomycetota bacterium]
MNPLQRRLAGLRYRLRLFVGWRGLCGVTAIVLGAAVVFGLIDWTLHLPGLIRAFLLVGVLGTAGFVFYRYLFLPITARCDDLSLALRIEAHFPDLNDALASTVQFLEDSSDDSPAAGSVALRKKAIERAMEKADDVDFGGILDRRGGFWITVAAVTAIAVAGYFLSYQPTFSGIAFWRLADPFGNHTWTRIDLPDCPDKVAQGRPFPIRASIDGVVPKLGLLEIDDGANRKDRPLEIKIDANTGLGTIVSGIDMTQHLGKFKFRIFAGDGAYPPGSGAWHEVTVLQPPRFAKLNGQETPQIELRPPAYTDLPPLVKLPPGNKYIQAFAGTHVTFRAAVDRPIEEAWIEFRPENPLVRTAAQLAPFGLCDPLAAASSAGLGGAVWNRVPAHFVDNSRKVFVMEFVPPVTGEYHFEMRENAYLSKDYNAALDIKADPLPFVTLIRPGSSMDVVGDADIQFKLSVEDEIFAIRSVYLEFRRKSAEGQWLDVQPNRIPLYDHAGMGAFFPRLSAALANSLWLAPDLRLRPRKLDVVHRWMLKNQFKEGETVVVRACADDFCDIEPGRPPGRSTPVELRIVTPKEITQALEKGLEKAQGDLVRLQQMQDNALNLVKEIKDNIAKGQVTQKEIDKLIEAEQIQRSMQERVGQGPEDGLRDELAKLLQTVKENKLPGSDVQDQIKTLKMELDRLATEELPQIEPNLAETRKELGGAAKPSPKDKSPLNKAERHQQETKTALDELAKFLEPWASMNEIRGKTRDILNQQQTLRKETEKLDDDMRSAAGKPKNQDEHRQQMQNKAETQKDLAEKTRNLLDQMGKAEQKRAKDGDQDAADKLKRAAAIGRQGLLPENMRDVADKLNPDNPHMQEALSKQNKNVEKLQRMLGALDSKKEDDIDRLTKKRKNAAQAEEAVEKLAKDQERLQKKAKEANKIADPKERERELKRLAEEQEKLKEEAQNNARELARLQEDKASQDLDRAAQQMEEAAQKLKDGVNPEENQKEALDRLENAQQKLQEFEDELAREQLAKIDDRIKGLKERQDAGVERSRELQKKVLGAKSWTRGLLGTLDADRLAQEGLATETRSLKEKLKDAKVFEHIFEKAARAMDQAADGMSKRKEAAADRQVGAMDKEEIADESKRGEDIAQKQTLASQRLQRLLDALKQEMPDPLAKNDPPPEGQPPPDQDQPRSRPTDGIPPLAQLKALRAEQVEVNERTKAIAKQNPDLNALPDDVRRELEEIHNEQGRLHRLFEEMTAPGQTAPDRKGEQP